MRTQSNHNHIVLAIGLAWLILGCGAGNAPRYPTKSYGGPAGGERQGSENLGAGGDTGEGGGTDGGEDGAVGPDTLVLDNQYRAGFDKDSVFKLTQGSVPSNNLGLARTTVMTRLSSEKADDGITVKQTFGDGERYSTGEQIIVNSVGDQDAAADASRPSESGVQTYRRVTGDEHCPGVFVCIDRLVFKPKTGSPSTYCYYDPESGEPTVIPYAVPPNYKSTDFDDNLKEYGPYIGKRFTGDAVDCKAPGGDADAVEDFRIVVRRGELTSGAAPLFQKPTGPEADYEIVLENRRVAQDDRAPYLDETLRLQYRTRFQIDSKQGVLTKMIKSVRKSVSLSGLASVLVNIDGILVDLHLELCANRLPGKEASYCD